MDLSKLLKAMESEMTMVEAIPRKINQLLIKEVGSQKDVRDSYVFSKLGLLAWLCLTASLTFSTLTRQSMFRSLSIWSLACF